MIPKPLPGCHSLISGNYPSFMPPIQATLEHLPPSLYLLPHKVHHPLGQSFCIPENLTLFGHSSRSFSTRSIYNQRTWGRLSDSHGRKPIIIIGLVASVISKLTFGFSRSIGALMFWRVLAGLGNGNVAVMGTMTAEIVKERKYQTRAFLLLPLVFNSGMVAELALGGCLADPVVNLP